jgi:hypothetical protein
MINMLKLFGYATLILTYQGQGAIMYAHILLILHTSHDLETGSGAVEFPYHTDKSQESDNETNPIAISITSDIEEGYSSTSDNSNESKTWLLYNPNHIEKCMLCVVSRECH